MLVTFRQLFDYFSQALQLRQSIGILVVADSSCFGLEGIYKNMGLIVFNTVITFGVITGHG